VGSQIDIRPEIDITEKAISQVIKLKEENNIPADYALRVGVTSDTPAVLVAHVHDAVNGYCRLCKGSA